MKKEQYNVAVVGATGAVGEQMLNVLSQRKFPILELRPLASSRSAGTSIDYNGKEYTVLELTEDSFAGIDIALFSAGGSVSERFAPAAAAAGAVVVDNTSAYRYEPDVPLVVPEVNPDALAGYTDRGIVANPNCSTIQMVVALKPLHDEAQIKRVVVSTYQATSGAGRLAMEELAQQSIALFNQQEIEVKKFAHQIAFNCLPQIDVFMDNAYTKEEMKMVWETNKIIGDDSIKVTATAVRVPTFACHGEAINIEFVRPISPDRARELFAAAPGIVVQDDPATNSYPLGINCVGRDETFVGRIRSDDTVEHGLNIWVVSDNLRKGAATNAVQIAELLIERYL
ncbi:MAG: aspartate-semialdehyde dehydrogenase [Candidatus Alcyoniella australis]|nr:aspartate-semialdehyde dehydrogenase [Candidatus Alcyoniella australis]